MALSASNKLTKVESKKVCMVNDKLFPTDQIPVKVGDKTYFGCCSMCKKTLAESKEARTAIDPVSKKSVDKATAVIGATATGTVQYFENEKNLTAYNAGRN
jgi:YHS domain-containing protein